MPTMDSHERKRIASMLQGATDLLAANIPDEVRISVTADDEILFDSWTWTSALTRHRFSPRWGIHNLDPTSLRDGFGVPREDAALLLIEKLIGPTIAIQQERWAIAETLGLVSAGRPVDLPPEEMMIDQTLIAMLDDGSIDVRSAAALVRLDYEFKAGDELPLLQVGANLGGCPIFVRQEGTGHPVIGTWRPVGKGYYDGTILAVDGSMPDTMMAASVGRRVEDIVSTGLAQLDERQVLGISEGGGGPYGFSSWIGVWHWRSSWRRTTSSSESPVRSKSFDTLIDVRGR